MPIEVGCTISARHFWTNLVGATNHVFVEVPVVLIRFLFLDVLSSRLVRGGMVETMKIVLLLNCIRSDDP